MFFKSEKNVKYVFSNTDTAHVRFDHSQAQDDCYLQLAVINKKDTVLFDSVCDRVMCNVIFSVSEQSCWSKVLSCDINVFVC